MKKYSVYQTMFLGVVDVPNSVNGDDAIIEYMNKNDAWPDKFMEPVDTELVEHRIKEHKMKQAKCIHEYMGCTIYNCDINSSGMRWSAIGKNGMLKADTLRGIKKLIKEDVQL